MYRTLNQLCSRSNILVSNQKFIDPEDAVYKKIYAYPPLPKPEKKEDDMITFSMLQKLKPSGPVNVEAVERRLERGSEKEDDKKQAKL